MVQIQCSATQLTVSQPELGQLRLFLAREGAEFATCSSKETRLNFGPLGIPETWEHGHCSAPSGFARELDPAFVLSAAPHSKRKPRRTQLRIQLQRAGKLNSLQPRLPCALHVW